MEYLLIYLLQLVDNLEWVTATLTVLAIFFVPAYIAWGFSTEFKFENYEGSNYGVSKDLAVNLSKIFKKTGIFVLIGCIICIFTPTKQTLLLLGGVYYGKKAVQNVVTSEKLEKVNTIIDLQLDKCIKDLQKGIEPQAVTQKEAKQ